MKILLKNQSSLSSFSKSGSSSRSRYSPSPWLSFRMPLLNEALVYKISLYLILWCPPIQYEKKKYLFLWLYWKRDSHHLLLQVLLFFYYAARCPRIHSRPSTNGVRRTSYPRPYSDPFVPKLSRIYGKKKWPIFFPTVILITNISSLVYFNLFSNSKILSFFRVNLAQKKNFYLFSFTWLSTFQLLYWLNSSWYIWVKF